MYTKAHFYKRVRFACIDMTLGLIALFFNPYRVSKKFLKKRGFQEIDLYGETPLATYERLARECEVGPEDMWVELGSGRGKGCFWLREFIKCKVRAVEQIPQFVFFARLICTLFRVKGIAFEKNDIEKVDLSKATIIYLYGLYPKPDIPPLAKVITTGEPLEGYRVIKRFWVRFHWGRTTAFLQTKAI